MSRIIPFGMPWAKALRLGYVGEIRLEAYLAWIRTLPCHRCHAPAPSQASHPNFLKSQKNKAPDPLALPECAACHMDYEHLGIPDEQPRLARAALYLVQAISEGRLRFTSKPDLPTPSALRTTSRSATEERRHDHRSPAGNEAKG